MAFTDEELSAAFDSYSSKPSTSFSDEELGAAFDSFQPPAERTWGDVATNTGKDFLKNLSGVGDFAYNLLNPGQAINSALASQVAPQISDDPWIQKALAGGFKTWLLYTSDAADDLRDV
jgi:hypothetical protein